MGWVGCLQIWGLNVISGYLYNVEVMLEVFIVDGWFNIGDLVMIGVVGLIIIGCEKDVIIINGVNFYSYEIEQVVDEIGVVQIFFIVVIVVCELGVVID